MKYGVVYYKDTDNIGDDIQNYAVMQFLPHVDYLIDREMLNDFSSSNGEPVATIMNGWFLHNKFNWPPAKDIYPLCISMHFSPNDYLGIGYKFLDNIGGYYLKNYEPIGCRDLCTKNMLEMKGIQCYLSGCVTLTLSKRRRLDDCEKYICVVDVPNEVEAVVDEKIDGTRIHLKKTTHWVNYQEQTVDWEERIRRVEELLDIYQNASCVITKRLHCALPCLALGTPVLLILDSEEDDITRYSHFTELLHVTSTKDFICGNTKYDILNPSNNKEHYLKERQEIINRITEFINNTENNRIDRRYIEWKNRDEKNILEWRQDLLVYSARYAACKIDSLLREINEIKVKAYSDTEKFAEQYDCDTTTLKNEILILQKEIERLDQVIERKSREEERLNNVILDKNGEEERLNNVILDKESIIERYRQAAEYVLNFREELETSSVIWLIFFSDKFRNSSIKQKICLLWRAMKTAKINEQLTVILDRLNNI